MCVPFSWDHVQITLFFLSRSIGDKPRTKERERELAKEKEINEEWEEWIEWIFPLLSHTLLFEASMRK
jgi:hypothetical protein